MNDPPTDRAQHAFDDADYPAYTMGRAAEMLGVTPDFLRSLGPAGPPGPPPSPAAARPPTPPGSSSGEGRVGGERRDRGGAVH